MKNTMASDSLRLSLRSLFFSHLISTKTPDQLREWFTHSFVLCELDKMSGIQIANIISDEVIWMKDRVYRETKERIVNELNDRKGSGSSPQDSPPPDVAKKSDDPQQ